MAQRNFCYIPKGWSYYSGPFCSKGEDFQEEKNIAVSFPFITKKTHNFPYLSPMEFLGIHEGKISVGSHDIGIRVKALSKGATN